MAGFQIGDYVIADRARFDTFGDVTWEITGTSLNLIGRRIFHVRDIARPLSSGTTFYPSELSWEDGSRPE